MSNDQPTTPLNEQPQAPERWPAAVVPLASLCDPGRSRLTSVQIQHDAGSGMATASATDGRIAAVVRWPQDAMDGQVGTRAIPAALLEAMRGRFVRGSTEVPQGRLIDIVKTVMAAQPHAFRVSLGARNLIRLLRYFITATQDRDCAVTLAITSRGDMITLRPATDLEDCDIVGAIMPVHVEPCPNDETLLTPKQTDACRRAIHHALATIRRHADLAWHLAHTETLERLIEAAAAISERDSTGGSSWSAAEIRANIDADWKRLDRPAEIPASRAKLDLIRRLAQPGMFDDDVQAMSAEDRLAAIAEIAVMSDQHAIERKAALEARST